MVRRLCLALAPVVAFFAQSALAEGPNLSADPQGGAGSAAQLYLAQRAYAAALVTGEVLPLLAAIRLAREVTLRPATGWELTQSGESSAEAVTGGPDLGPDLGPGGEAALTIARNLAGEDPDLQDLVYDLDAQRPGGRTATAVEVRGDLGPGQTDDWRLPLFGEVAAEIALIGNGPLAFTVTDESGAIVCAQPASTTPVLCRVTPARNGFFTLSVHNPGPSETSYQLIGN